MTSSGQAWNVKYHSQKQNVKTYIMSEVQQQYQALSPDGFDLFNGERYNSTQEAEQAYHTWARRYNTQGYYSSNKGRIPLDELRDHCKIIPIK